MPMGLDKLFFEEVNKIFSEFGFTAYAAKAFNVSSAVPAKEKGLTIDGTCEEISVSENVTVEEIIKGTRPPDTMFYQFGRDDRDKNIPYHAGPRPFTSVAALSWRMGWNSRALELNDL